MSNLVGRVHFTASLDGRGTERDAERVGRQAGEAAGKGYDSTWSKSFRDSLTREGKAALTRFGKNGEASGTEFGKAFQGRLDSYLRDAQKSFDGLRIDADFLDQFSKGFDDAGLAAGRLQEQLNTLRETNQITEAQYDRARVKVSAWADAQRDAADATNQSIERSEAEARVMAALDERVRQHTQARENLTRVLQEQDRAIRDNALKAYEKDLDDLEKRTRAATDANNGFGLSWGNLSHNTRQWTLIIGAIASGMQDIAVLGSAAGAGLVALGGAATSGVIGIGGVAAVIATLNKDLDELPSHLQPVVQEFQRFTPVFGEVREAIATGAFSRMPGVFDSLGDSVRALTPQFAALGVSVGNVFSDFAQNTREGTDAFREISTLVRNAGPNFERLSDSAGILGVALVRSFNRAQPLVEGLIGYVDTLARRFDAFTRSNGFDVWMSNATRTFSALVPLLDATGRALNDLVTPESVGRTVAFLDNLTGFMPNLGKLLDVVGRLDVFGLLAQMLNEFGQALEPLAEPAMALADALQGQLSTAISALADVMGVTATLAAPLAQALADIVDAIPPGVLQGLVYGLGAVAAAIGVLNAGNSIAAVVSKLSTLSAGFDTTAGKAGKMANGIAGALGKAGVVGMAVAGTVALTNALDDVYRSLTNVEDRTRNVVSSNASFAEAYDELGRSAFGVVTPLTDVNKALDNLTGSGVQGMVGSLGNLFRDGGREANALSQSLGELSRGLAGLDIEQSISQFSAYARELGATDAQVLNMLNTMPEFKQAIIDQATVLGEQATDANLVAIALGELGNATYLAAVEQQNSAIAAAQQEAALALMQGRAVDSSGAIADLADKIRGFSEAAYASRDSAREFEAAIDGVTDSVAANGNSLDITTEAGRNNEKALDDLAQASLDLSANILEQTGSQEGANAAINRGRDELIKALEQFGITGQAAQDYADMLGLIPTNIFTQIDANTQDAQNKIDGFISRNNGRRITIFTTNTITGGPANPGTGGNNLGLFASGTIATGPTAGIFGEAGPEALVPLDRPLSMVDPRVRWLSAIAQGKTKDPALPQFASGGVVSGGTSRTMNFQEGSITIVVQGSTNPVETAEAVFGRFMEAANS